VVVRKAGGLDVGVRFPTARQRKIKKCAGLLKRGEDERFKSPAHFLIFHARIEFMDNLSQKHCVPCEGGTLPLPENAVAEYLRAAPEWKAIDGKKIAREFKFKDFKAAMAFINKVAEIAEAEQHHPDIYIFYNLVKLELSTHAIGGLSENDFIVAAKIDLL
jgi:4a-hydroxytetrahydrobiopterin dehydratase